MTAAPPQPPADLLRTLAADRSRFPPGGRAEAERWLQAALVDYDALQAHFAALGRLTGKPVHLPRPRRDRAGEAADERPAGLPPPPLTDPRVVAVCDGGLGVLTDAELAALMLDAHALFDLFDVIDELMPEAWLADVSAAAAPPAAVPTTPSAVARPRAPAWAALAAGILVGGLGLFGLQAWTESAGGSPGATFRAADVRGAQASSLVATITSGFDGYAAVVVVSPNAAPAVYPGLGAEPWRVAPGKSFESPPLPAAAGAEAVVVVTPTPAGEMLRAAVGRWAKEATARDARSLEAAVRTALAAGNYRKVATSVVGFAPAP